MRILIVDDEESIQDSLAMIFETDGHETFGVDSGQKAVAYCDNEEVDVVLMDVKLPDMSGVDALAKIKAKHDATEVVMLTAYASMDVAIESLNLGSYAFVQKPYEAEHVLAILRSIDDKKQLQAENLRILKKLEATVHDLDKANKELSQHNEHLQAENEAKSRFLSNVSHEIRTPLNAIIGFADALRKGLCGETNEEQSKYLGIICKSGGNLLEIISDLLDISKIQSGQFDIHLTEVNLYEAINSSVETMQMLASQKEIDIAWRVPPDDYIMADAISLEQILINLLSNAIKYSSSESKIEISTQQRAGQYKIRIKDQGIGIAQDKQKSIFDAYLQLDRRRKSKDEQSSGLGLAICKGLMEAHGGWIELESKPKAGSTFTLVFPVN